VKGTRSGATIHSLSLNVYMNFVNFIIDFFASIIIKKIARWVKDMVIGMLKLTISMDLNWVGGMDCQHYRNGCPTWRCGSYEME
jgi:hypothetical protein